MSSPQLVAALDLAARGWHVFPLNGKVPATEHGLHDATADRPQILRWWRAEPDAGIGIRCGRESGLVVLDIDPDHGGDDALHELEREHGALPETIEALTGGGGRHVYFRHPGGEIKNSVGKLGPGLDIRGDGGYVVAAPSRHPSGRRYAWEVDHHPDDLPAGDLPAWLLDGARNASRNGSAPAVRDAIPAGGRNAALASLAGTMRRRGMSAAEIAAALKVANAERCKPPLSDEEVEGIAASVSRYQPATPIAPTPKAEPEPQAEAPDEPPAPEHVTDLGNARRFARDHGEDLRYVYEFGTWLVYEGGRWGRDVGPAVVQRAKQTVRGIYAEAEAAPEERRKELGAWAVRSESEARLSAMVSLARSELPIGADELDCDPWALVVENGILDLRTGELGDHDREAFATRRAPTRFDPDARSARWEAFLARATDGDEELAAFLRRAAGYSLTGETSEEVLFFAHGPEATGKSTFLEANKATVGEYAATADFETFLARRGDAGIRNDVARLAGVRLVTSLEVDEGKRLAEGLVKQLTGGDRVAARFLHKEFFEFDPRFKLWLAANSRPRVNADDGAIWRRIVQVPFTVTIPEAERDPELKRALRSNPDERAAILAWAVAGCLEWQAHGLAVPERVRDYTEEYRRENDPLRDWIEDRCELDPEAETTAKALRESYTAWAEENGEKALAPNTVAKHLKSRGIHRKRGRAARAWRGIRVRGVTA